VAAAVTARTMPVSTRWRGQKWESGWYTEYRPVTPCSASHRLASAVVPSQFP
jgi:hypothetical protein